MKKWGITLIATICVASSLAVACGGGGEDDDNGDETTTSGTRTATRTSGTGTPDADGTGTPGADETAGTTDGTAASGTPAQNSGTPVPNATTAPGQPTAAAGTTPTNPGATPAAADPETPPTPSDEERAVNEEVDEALTGGDPNSPPEVVTDLPPVPAGATIDPRTIAPPNATAGGIEWIVDLNASEPGIQTSRSVKVGDVVRVGIVVTNLPGGSDALSAFGMAVGYDYTKIIAPSIEGGSALARNPDFNEAALGGAPSGWQCMPPGPTGDGDEPGTYEGDGDPATGQAFIGCFTAGDSSTASGTIVLAVLQFQAVATGTSTIEVLDHSQTGLWGGGGFAAIGGCGGEVSVPCRSASITVTN